MIQIQLFIYFSPLSCHGGLEVWMNDLKVSNPKYLTHTYLPTVPVFLGQSRFQSVEDLKKRDCRDFSTFPILFLES